MPRSALRLFAILVCLAQAAGAEAPALPEQERQWIEALIASVAQLRNARFVRNGKAYSAPDAARFLREKWESREDDVHSAQDFIEKVGTLSSTTGKPYQIHHADGREQPSAEFLTARLTELRGEKADAEDDAPAAAPENFLQPNLSLPDGTPLYLHFGERDMPLRVAIAKPATPAKYGSSTRTREVAIEAMRLWETALQPRLPWFRLVFVEKDDAAPIQIVWKRRLTGPYSGFGGIGYDVVDGALRVRGEMTLSTTPNNRYPLTIDDIRIVVAHEFGHVLGLLHCHACDSAMNYAWDTRDQVIVTELDVATIVALVAQPLPEPEQLVER